MKKEDLILNLIRQGITPDEAYLIAYNFKSGLKTLGKMRKSRIGRGRQNGNFDKNINIHQGGK